MLKDSPLHEIQEALALTVRGRQYICTDVQQLIDAPEKEEPDRSPLSKTEKDMVFAERLRMLMDAQPYDRREMSRRSYGLHRGESDEGQADDFGYLNT